MNNVSITGRFTRDPDIRWTQGQDQRCIARFTLAVDRDFKTEAVSADFVSCIAFGKTAEFIEKYFRKGIKMELSGRLQTGSYTDRDGRKVYTTDVVAERVGFAESKKDHAETPTEAPAEAPSEEAAGDGFMTIPDNIDDQLPFH